MTKKEKTRERILQYAWQLFIKNGYENTSTREISTSAEIATGTLFTHFDVKLDILHDCLETRFNAVIVQAKETDFHRSARMKITHYAQYFFQFYCQHLAFYRTLFANKLFAEKFQQQQLTLMHELIFSDQPQFNKVKAAILLDCYFMTLLHGLSEREPKAKLMLHTLSQKVSLL